MDAPPKTSASKVFIMFIAQFFEKLNKVLPEEKPITGTDKFMLFLKACRKVLSGSPAPIISQYPTWWMITGTEPTMTEKPTAQK